MLSSLKVKNFRIYWLGMFVSLIGTWIQAVAQSWLVFELTNSAFLLGIVGFLSTIPVFFLSLFGGVLADRANKRNILIFTQCAFMLLAFLLAVLVQFKLITPGQIMVVALANGMVMAFDAPSRQALVVELVGKDHLFNAIALNSVAFNSSRIIGPVFAALFVAAIGMAGCFYINGISFIAVIIALFLVKINHKAKTGKNNKTLKDLKDGLIFIKNHQLILTLIMIVGVVSLFGNGYVILMPIFANDILKTGVKGLGLLMSGSGFGALIGALILMRLGSPKYRGGLLIVSSMLFSLALMLFSLSRLFWLSLFALMLIGACGVVAIALINTLLQTKVNDEFRGRVMGVFMLTFAGFMPFSNLLSGTLAQAFGVSFTVFLSGAVCAAILLVINVAYPPIRKV